MNEAEAEMAIPHLFICPISLDLLRDPVTLCTGQTYDRSSIEKWLAAGNLTCPVTMQKLNDLSMVPNHTLRNLIDEWLQMGSQFHPHHHHHLTLDDSLALLKHQLQSPDSTLESKFQSLQRVQDLLEVESTSTILHFLQLGFLPFLLQLLFHQFDEMSQDTLKFSEQALCCVLKLLPLTEYESLNILKEESKLESLVILLENGTLKIKVGLCHIIEAVSSSLETAELCSIIGKNGRLLQGLVILVVQENFEATQAGIRAISAICSVESNRENLVQEGVLNGLLLYISNAEGRERNSAARAMAAIELLIEVESGKEAVISNPNGIRALVKMVFRVSDHEGSESAVKSLMIICRDSLQAKEEAICAGVLTQLLLLLQSQCSSRTKTKARMLLKLLRSKSNEEQENV